MSVNGWSCLYFSQFTCSDATAPTRLKCEECTGTRMINGRSVADNKADRIVSGRFSGCRTKPGHT
jgi:hypothetical protein